jgi:hypothetical protein
MAFLGLAVGLGLASADPRVQRWAEGLARNRPFRWLVAPTDTDVKRASVWYIVMHMYDHDPGPVEVGAQLDDGSYVRGRLSHMNVAAAETADRDLLLEAPIKLVTAGGEEADLGWQFTILSARRLVRLDVTHLRPVEVEGGSDSIRSADQ